jgi:hypothetical protein
MNSQFLKKKREVWTKGQEIVALNKKDVGFFLFFFFFPLFEG